MSRTEIIEWVVLLGGVFALWPITLGYLGDWPIWLRFLYYAVVIGALVKVLRNRNARIRQAIRRPEDEDRGNGR